MKTETRGGKRQNSGRKKLPAVKVPIIFYVLPETRQAAKLKHGKNLSSVLNTLLKNSLNEEAGTNP